MICFVYIIETLLDDGTSRTVLRCNGEQGTDYINASYVNVNYSLITKEYSNNQIDVLLIFCCCCC